MQLRRSARLARVSAAVLAVLGIAWHQASRHVCRDWSCYRLGNYLDFILQRELWRSYGGDAAIPAPLASVLHRYAMGAWVRRLLLLGSHPTLLEHAFAHRPPTTPCLPRTFWNTSSGIALLQTLRNAVAAGHGARGVDVLWHRDWRHDRATRACLAASVRELIDTFAPPERRPLGALRDARTTCVVHLRVGDFAERHTTATLLSMVSAVAALRPLPTRVVILGGGVGHGCQQLARQQCGQWHLGRLRTGLQAAVPNASVLMSNELLSPRLGTASGVDDDFLMLADAGEVVGTVGSSFSWFGQLVKRTRQPSRATR